MMEWITCPVCACTQLEDHAPVYWQEWDFSSEVAKGARIARVCRVYYRRALRCKDCGRVFLVGNPTELDADLVLARSGRLGGSVPE